MEVLNMDIIDELRAIENIYEVEIDGVWYVDMSDLSDEDKEKVEKLIVMSIIFVIVVEKHIL